MTTLPTKKQLVMVLFAQAGAFFRLVAGLPTQDGNGSHLSESLETSSGGSKGIDWGDYNATDYVWPMIGNAGDSPNGAGGTIPSSSPPFAMSRWVAQTTENFVSQTPYNWSDTTIYGFQLTHQPAVWMGESAPMAISPGFGKVKPAFKERGMRFTRENGGEESKPYEYKVTTFWDGDGNANGTRDGSGREKKGSVKTEIAATSHVGHFRFTFNSHDPENLPYLLFQTTRTTIVSNNLTRPRHSWYGDINLSIPSNSPSSSMIQISGTSPERQDDILGPSKAPSFKGYWVAEINLEKHSDVQLDSWGTATTTGGIMGEDKSRLNDGNTAVKNQTNLSGYLKFKPSSKTTSTITVRIGTSFISYDQARSNLASEVPNSQSWESTRDKTKSLWEEKLGRIRIPKSDLKKAGKEKLTTFYTAAYHALQSPYEIDEGGKYYSGYDDQVHEGKSYSGLSIWDTYRAENAWLILWAPERMPGIITSMLQDYQQGGWLPMWKNLVETNIMIGTHADSLIAESVLKGIDGFDRQLAYQAVKKDADVPPVNDSTTQYADREEGVGYEVRAGLSSVLKEKGWVANELHTESTSRTLDYSFDDFAVSVVAEALGDSSAAAFYRSRSRNYRKIFNKETGFMEARFANGSWAGDDQGWTEGDKWVYTFEVLQDIPGLISLIGGREAFIRFLDKHFDEGHNDHANEPSHHVPYLYAIAGDPSKGQKRIRNIAKENYNHTANGLSGNEDCGQMSAWYTFSALGFYPVNPSSIEYIVGTPFFENISLRLPSPQSNSSSKDITLTISAPDAFTKPYIKSLTINGKSIDKPIVNHQMIMKGGEWKFEMSGKPTQWGNGKVWGTPLEEDGGK